MNSKFIKFCRIPVLLIIIIFFSVYFRNLYLNFRFNENDIKNYSNYFYNYYSEYVSINLLKHDKEIIDYRNHFPFYKNKPYKINILISSKKGASVEYIPNSTLLIVFNHTNEIIEKSILNTSKYDYSSKTDECKNSAIILANKTMNMLSSFAIDTNGACFVNIKNDSGVILKNIDIDGVKHNNYLIIKSGNKKKNWSRSEAKNDSYFLYTSELVDAILNSSEFRQYFYMPKLKKIADEIVSNENKGFYKDTYGLLFLEKDIKRLKDIAAENNIDTSYADKLLETVRKYEKPWNEEHPWIFNIAIGVIVAILISFGVALFNKLFRRNKKN
jgi:hypothetical protein